MSPFVSSIHTKSGLSAPKTVLLESTQTLKQSRTEDNGSFMTFVHLFNKVLEKSLVLDSELLVVK